MRFDELSIGQCFRWSDPHVAGGRWLLMRKFEERVGLQVDGTGRWGGHFQPGTEVLWAECPGPRGQAWNGPRRRRQRRRRR